MDFSFTAEQDAMRSTVRKFVEKELTKEYLRKWDEDENLNWLSPEILKKAAGLGLFAAQVPKEYGGLDGTLIDGVIITEEVGRRSPAASLVLGGGSLYVDLLVEHGTEQQKNAYLPGLAQGEITFAVGLTEPAGGTDLLGALSTSATADGDDYILNGQKVYITGAHMADRIVTLAITDKSASKRSRAMSLFLVDPKSAGLETRLMHKISMRGLGANEVFYTDVRVPKTDLLGELHKGFYHLIKFLNPERIICAAATVGLAQGAFEEALEYAKTRIAFGKPIGQFQTLQHWLADMAVEIEMGRMMTYKAAWLLSVGEPCHFEAAAANAWASETAVKTTTNAMEIFGGAGVTMEYDIQRYFRDARQFTFSPISNEMSRNFIGESLGLPRSF